MSLVRIISLGLVWLLVALLLMFRLSDLAVNHVFLLEKSQKATTRSEWLLPKRGELHSSRGNQLVANEPVWGVAIDPSLLQNIHPDMLNRLSRDFSVSKAHLKSLIRSKPKSRFAWLNRSMVMEGQVMSTWDKEEGVFPVKHYRRVYPQGHLGLEAILGKVDVDGLGLEGLEYQYNQLLSGKRGFRRTVINPIGQIVKTEATQAKVDGQSIQLTLDDCLQFQAYKAISEAVNTHEAFRGGLLVVEADTGAIKAVAQATGKGHAKQRKAWVFTDLYEPGSLFKPIVMAYLLDHGLGVTKGVDVNQGEWTIGRDKVTDVHKAQWLSLTDVIAYSSNVGMSKLMLSLPAGFEIWLKSSGLLAKIATGFPGMPSGRVISKPSQFERATLSFGYGVSLSMAQIVQAYTAIANHGLMAPLCLVDCKTPQGGKVVFTPSTAARVNDMLNSAVEYGTGRAAGVNGLQVGGKTGTAHKIDGRTYSASKHVASFIGVTTAGNQKYVVLVLIDEPKKGHFGATVAAPVFKRFVSESFVGCRSFR